MSSLGVTATANPPGARLRAGGALYGLAIGDALGMPTQLLPRDRVLELYGPWLDGFHPGPEANPVSAGMPAGAVTDDTDQAVIVAVELLRSDGWIDHGRLAEALIDWERVMAERGSLDLLGPSTKRALTRFGAGQLEIGASDGDTNGAAMRIGPVGIAFPAAPAQRLLHAVVRTSELTHNTGVAIAGAAAVAGAISAGIDGAGVDAALRTGVHLARRARTAGNYAAAADVAHRIEWAIGLVAERPLEDVLEDIYLLVGTGVATQEAVPAAFAVASAAGDDPWLACRLAASLGGDTDTIAAMAGAILGAVHGRDAFPAAALARIDAVNPDLGLTGLADDLLGLRQRMAVTGWDGQTADPGGRVPTDGQ